MAAVVDARCMRRTRRGTKVHSEGNTSQVNIVGGGGARPDDQ